MLTRILSCVAVLLLGSSVFVASPLAAQAQDCGKKCDRCGLDGWEGREASAGAAYNMDCTPFISYCVACRPEQTRVGDAPPDAGKIVRLIQSTPAADLQRALRRYRDRLLFAPNRNLVVVQGTGCDPKALSTVLFVDPQKAEALRALGLRSFKAYLNGA